LRQPKLKGPGALGTGGRMRSERQMSTTAQSMHQAYDDNALQMN